MTTGTRPLRTVPAIYFDTDNSGGFERDAFGIVVGGVRTPWVEVPASILSGLGQEGEVFGMLWGTTAPLPFAQLFARYPGGRAQYSREFAEATQRAVAAGLLLAEDAAEINGVGVATWPFWPRG